MNRCKKFLNFVVIFSMFFVFLLVCFKDLSEAIESKSRSVESGCNDKDAFISGRVKARPRRFKQLRKNL